MRTFSVLLIAMSLSWNTFAGTSEAFKLKTARGVDVEVIADYPEAESKVPAVVIAPGQGYHMQRPIIQEVTQKALAKGVAVIRFNWHYFSTDPQNGQPSVDLKNEIDDMQTVLNYAKGESRIDPAQIILAGKSLGTFVSYNLFKTDDTLKALVLMTPVCTWAWDENDNPLPNPVAVGEKNYPSLQTMTRPVVIALGSKDPLCSLPMLYDFLKDTKGNVVTVVVGGDHSWNIGPSSDPAYQVRNSENITQATSAVAHWISIILAK